MYSKSTTVSKATLQAALNKGGPLYLLVGNNTTDQIDHGSTVLWNGTGSIPSYTYSKCWLVPATTSQGVGSLLGDIIDALVDEGLTSVKFTVKNDTDDIITHAGTTAVFTFAQRSMDNWDEDVS